MKNTTKNELNISSREYQYAILLEGWFFETRKDLSNLQYLLDVVIPFDVKNSTLNEVLIIARCLCSQMGTSDTSSMIQECKSLIVKLVDLDLKTIIPSSLAYTQSLEECRLMIA